jgi:hypothetical protein
MEGGKRETMRGREYGTFPADAARLSMVMRNRDKF